MRGDQIVAAGCILPLSQNPRLSPQLGTRHRAALGISEETDAVAVCISEHSGAISVAWRGVLLERWTHLLHLDSNERVVGAGESIALGGSLTSRIENRGSDVAVLVHVSSPANVARPCGDSLRLVS